MSSSVLHIVINEVEPIYNASFIAKAFWNKGVGMVSSITILPQIIRKDGSIKNIVYVDFDSICDSEAGDAFTRALSELDGVLFPFGDESNIWLVQLNTHNSGGLCVGDFTTHFVTSFFTNSDPIVDEPDDEAISCITIKDENSEHDDDDEDDEDNPHFAFATSLEQFREKMDETYETYEVNDLKREESRPVATLNGNLHFNIRETHDYLWSLGIDLSRCSDREQAREIVKEIDHLETQLMNLFPQKEQHGNAQVL